jgi:hypothetical protein
MRLKIAALLSLLALMGLAAPAMATYWGEFSGSADCDGYSFTGTFITTRTSFDVDYTVSLMQGSTTLATVAGVQTVSIPGLTFTLAGPWGLTLCGDYTVSGSYHIQTPDNDTRTFAAAFTCTCPDDACHFTPGYWKNHPEAWPLDSVTLGGVTYTKAQALVILQKPVRGDATIILAHHLIAAILNVANGASDSINGAIADANAYLVEHPLYSAPTGDAKTEGENSKNELAGYNELGCPPVGAVTKALSSSTGSVEKSTGTQTSTWGALKGNYR